MALLPSKSSLSRITFKSLCACVSIFDCSDGVQIFQGNVFSECTDAGCVLANGAVIHLAPFETMNYLLLCLLGFMACVEF